MRLLLVVLVFAFATTPARRKLTQVKAVLRKRSSCKMDQHAL